MKLYAMIAATVVACASNTPEPACPKCYEIDEVAPYEPPHRMIILCDEPPDASVDDYKDYRLEDAGDDDPFARVF